MENYVLCTLDGHYLYSGTKYEIAEYLKVSVKSLALKLSYIKDKRNKIISYNKKEYIIIEFNDMIRGEENDNNK